MKPRRSPVSGLFGDLFARQGSSFFYEIPGYTDLPPAPGRDPDPRRQGARLLVVVSVVGDARVERFLPDVAIVRRLSGFSDCFFAPYSQYGQ